MDRAKYGQVLQQLQQTALRGSGTVVELRGVNLSNQVEQDAQFMLKLTDECVFRRTTPTSSLTNVQFQKKFLIVAGRSGHCLTRSSACATPCVAIA